MRNLKKDFENRKIDFEKLLEYGFKIVKNKYVFEKVICDTFLVVIVISKKNQYAKVMDIIMNDEYLLVDINASGEYVGKIREEYDNILNDVLEKCTTLNIFKSKQAQAVIKYIKKKYNDDLEYLWVKFPNNAVWRNKENKKWYGALLVLSESKLGLLRDKIIDIIDLRYQKDKIEDIIDNKNIFRGYHMNKNNWITLRLDGSVDINKIYKLIDNSYELSLEK